MATDTLFEEVSKRAGWSIFMGMLTAAVGVVMIIYPLATAAASTVFFGSALIVAGGRAARSSRSLADGGEVLSQPPARHSLRHRRSLPGCAPGIGLVTLTAVLGAMLIAEAVSKRSWHSHCRRTPAGAGSWSTRCSVCCSA